MSNTLSMSQALVWRSLLLREWMQHRGGWLLLMALPSLLMAGLGLLDQPDFQVQLGSHGAVTSRLNDVPVPLQVLGWSAGTIGLALLLVALALTFQLPGLARRDEQDGSLAFWRSLPVGHAQAVGATLVMHLLLLPGLVLACALLGAQLVTALAVVLHNGALAWLQQPWGVLALSLPLALGRLWLGLLMAMLWLSPLLLLTMAAAAWLKRWGAPVVAALSLWGVWWLDARLPQPLVAPAFSRIGNEALYAVVAPDLFQGPHALRPEALADGLAGLPAALLQDAGRVLASAVSLPFLLALAGGALGFVLLVLRRARSA